MAPARAIRLASQERDLERGALRRREPGGLQPVAEIDQRRERELRLGPARTGGRDPHAALTRELDSGLPQRRLAESGAAGEDERLRREAGGEGARRSSSVSRPTTPACLDFTIPLCQIELSASVWGASTKTSIE